MRNSWIFIFPIMIIVAMLYLILYDETVQEEEQASLNLVQKQAIADIGVLEPTQSTILKYMKDEAMMKAMRVLFIKHCSECHGVEGTGVAGSNLCDDNYTFVKTLPDIFESISVGNIKKGMTPFAGTLSDTEMILLTSYVANLRGSNSGGKFSEGVVIEPWN
jgi:mono/diheme cytochrome c family protein